MFTLCRKVSHKKEPSKSISSFVLFENDVKTLLETAKERLGFDIHQLGDNIECFVFL